MKKFLRMDLIMRKRLEEREEVIKTFELNKMTKKELIEFASEVFLIKEKFQGGWSKCVEERWELEREQMRMEGELI